MNKTKTKNSFVQEEYCDCAERCPICHKKKRRYVGPVSPPTFPTYPTIYTSQSTCPHGGLGDE